MKVLGKSSLSAKLKLLLDVTWYVGIAGAGAWIVVALMNMNVGGHPCTPTGNCTDSGIVDNVSFRMDSTANQFQSVEGSAAYFSGGFGKLVVRGQVNQSTVILMIIEGIVLASLFLFAIWQLRKLFKTFVDGAPFTPTNIQRLRWIAASIFGVCVFSSLFSLLKTYLLDQQFSGQGIRLISRGDLNVSTVFAAVVIFVLAEIFRLGSELEDEKAHTV